MSLITKLFGASPEKLEHKGDTLFEAGKWGHAKLEYERALVKGEKAHSTETGWKERVEKKILAARNKLAREHFKNAEDLAEGGFFEEAGDTQAVCDSISIIRRLEEAPLHSEDSTTLNTSFIEKQNLTGLCLSVPSDTLPHPSQGILGWPHGPADGLLQFFATG